MDKPIPWKELELPEGRTIKAVQVMVDKEKSKVRKAQAAATGEEGSEAPGTPTPATPASKGKVSLSLYTSRRVALTYVLEARCQGCWRRVHQEGKEGAFGQQSHR